jgi:hypothetical protein
MSNAGDRRAPKVLLRWSMACGSTRARCFTELVATTTHNHDGIDSQLAPCAGFADASLDLLINALQTLTIRDFENGSPAASMPDHAHTNRTPETASPPESITDRTASDSDSTATQPTQTDFSFPESVHGDDDDGDDDSPSFDSLTYPADCGDTTDPEEYAPKFMTSKGHITTGPEDARNDKGSTEKTRTGLLGLGECVVL